LKKAQQQKNKIQLDSHLKVLLTAQFCSIAGSKSTRKGENEAGSKHILLDNEVKNQFTEKKKQASYPKVLIKKEGRHISSI
jgi:hypothetical protein